MAMEAGFLSSEESSGCFAASDFDMEICAEEYAYGEIVERFANLVEAASAAEEREACAKMVEPLNESLADAIRARGQQVCERCGKVNPAEIHTCTPIDPLLEALRVPENKREWVGLTDEEIKKLSDDCAGVRDEIEFIRAIEQALKEKNT